MKFKYCPDCSALLTARDLGDEKAVPWCDSCHKPWFEMFPCCVIIVARRNGKYALIRQKNCDRSEKGKFVCVSGYIKTCETAEQAAVREVNEELGLEVLSVKLISSYVYEKKQMLMLGFVADVGEGDFKLSDELLSAQWFDESEARKNLKETFVCDVLLEDILKCRS